MLSAYEQERLDNIARNQAFLDAIGLGDDKPDLIPKKKNKRCRDDTDDDDEGPTGPTRKSARVAKLDPEHGQLTDDFCIAEERGLLRSKRAKTEPVKAYSEIQAEELRCSEARGILTTCCSQTQSLGRCRTPTRTGATTEYYCAPTCKPQGFDAAARPTGQHADIVLPPAQPTVTNVKPGARYPVKGETAVCPLCNGLHVFVLKKPKFCPIEQKWKAGEFRKHTCVSVHAIMPQRIEV